MLRSFGCIAALGFAMFPAFAQAREVKLLCHDETYVCYTDESDTTKCRWAPGDDYPVTVALEVDDRYPNETSPQRVFYGEHTEHVNDAMATLSIILIESPNGNVGYTNKLRVTIGSITSETTGVSYLRSALRVRDNGTGYTCTITGQG